jgi:hypothetical protein|uniref:Uncharacterized protein n=1 Tax=Siphoviridae sp. ctt5z12 TaxID=2823604 RepID=A0A8S5LBV3_9CAUD|nr:MAG TPA: hypothetical protein [Siphoviridae sp. ctt5z12]
MTTEEMIEVMQAYVRGEAIEVSDKGASNWSEIKYPLWDWNSFEYRVKPAKKVTLDKNLNKRFISKQLSNIAELIDTDIFIYEGKCISVDDVLWYWEFKMSDGWHISQTRMTRAQAQAFVGESVEIAPLYGLGFRIKESE